MGDRGNIAIKQSSGQVWLYSHWAGYTLPARLRAALARQQRWDDEAYLARIIICEAIPEKHIKDETGFGISTCMQDNEYSILVVDIPKQRVFIMPEDALKDRQIPADYEPAAAFTFEQYADLGAEVDWDRLEQPVTV